MLSKGIKTSVDMSRFGSRNVRNIIQLPAKYVKETFGRVHSIDTFSALDGEGIRYMMFLQGCNLKCKSCSNRDTWDHHGGNGMSSKMIINNINRYRSYLDGVTISGGEPLLQPHFVSSLFQECHNINLTTCIDTAGQSLSKNWHMILPHTDMVLFCLKSIDPIKYQKFTGMPQSTALKFLDTLEDYKIPYYMRYLYIPGYTDDIKDIDKFIKLAKQLEHMKCIEFLPYHRLGVNKWDVLGVPYQLKDVKVPSKEKIDEVKEYIESAGLHVL
jgi:pyruvate formate lyase activating enzyme